MYQVIARKYRPQIFAELIGQEHVKTTLENAIASGRIAHGYIFSGHRGTGKTTVARILARCLNCEKGPTATPCGVCASCVEIAQGSSVDVIEIDAASNRGINEMRELRESVRFRPARDRYKVFIVDEAHQITSEAFNALLKTLEEPPEWVVFVLCTTEAHKIPSTISSRCQQFSFRTVDFPALVGRMEWIAQQEGIEADAETLSVLAQAGEGSVRDSLSALDQAIACCGTKLDAAQVRELLGVFGLESLEQVTTALDASVSGSAGRQMLEIVAELDANGRSLQHFARELARFMRNLLVARIVGTGTRLIAASPAEQKRLVDIAGSFSEEDLTRFLKLSLDLFRDLQSSQQPRLHLEMGLLRLVHAGRLQPIEEALASLSGPSTGGAGLQARAGSPDPATGGLRTSAARTPRADQEVRPTASAPATTAAVVVGADLRARLHAAMVDAKQVHLADAIEHCEVTESPAEVVFLTPKLYQMYLKGADFENIVRRVTGRPVKVTVKVGETIAAPVPMAQPAAASGAADEAAQRALAHPEVKRFQELFPASQVRTVRNLRENES
jgi:DNA polymerase-3 subunit gamma/tau